MKTKRNSKMRRIKRKTYSKKKIVDNKKASKRDLKPLKTKKNKKMMIEIEL